MSCCTLPALWQPRSSTPTLGSLPRSHSHDFSGCHSSRRGFDALYVNCVTVGCPIYLDLLTGKVLGLVLRIEQVRRFASRVIENVFSTQLHTLNRAGLGVVPHALHHLLHLRMGA